MFVWQRASFAHVKERETDQNFFPILPLSNPSSPTTSSTSTSSSVLVRSSSLLVVKMPHSFGLRARTRHLFAQKHRQHGPVRLSTYLRPYHVGDIVDIKANASEQKGMPHKVGIVYGQQQRVGRDLAAVRRWSMGEIGQRDDRQRIQADGGPRGSVRHTRAP